MKQDSIRATNELIKKRDNGIVEFSQLKVSLVSTQYSESQKLEILQSLSKVIIDEQKYPE